MTIALKGITWGHVRGISPLEETTKQFQLHNPHVSIDWEARSLEDFEDYPIDILAEKYDLILMDHPFIGTGVQKGVIVPLDEWLSEEFLMDQASNSVGGSFGSYTWEGHQWALAVDAAAQVSAYRADLFDEWGLEAPKTWDAVFELIRVLPNGTRVGFPLSPTHTYCSFLALCANLGGNDFWDEVHGINPEIGEQSLHMLQRLASMAHPQSLSSNPIHVSDLMSSTNEVAYVPLMFGYSNYARSGFRPNVIHYTNIPSTHSEPAGGVLGGVGIAVSARSKHKREAVNYAGYVAGPDCQRGLYFESEGQPGHRKAWMDSEVNRHSHGFFENTLRTLDMAYLRPRYAGYPQFQEKAGEILHSSLVTGGSIREGLQNLNQVYQNMRKESVRLERRR
jgi:multiple sugar transport system substrate-binding protein